ncbi:MAG: ABC transporter substrate-binding protein [Bradyrhizobium sp.]|nr:ABC transporter substrate-binding protein [Bradyrhizobium sp.]
MRRRDFLGILGGAVAARPHSARAQQALPLIGFLHSGTLEQNANRLVGFRKGLSDAGFVENQNVTIEYRWADGQNGRLPELAADLVRRKVAVIVAVSSQPATLAAKATTTTIPIVFILARRPGCRGAGRQPQSAGRQRHWNRHPE